MPAPLLAILGRVLGKGLTSIVGRAAGGAAAGGGSGGMGGILRGVLGGGGKAGAARGATGVGTGGAATGGTGSNLLQSFSKIVRQVGKESIQSQKKGGFTQNVAEFLVDNVSDKQREKVQRHSESGGWQIVGEAGESSGSAAGGGASGGTSGQPAPSEPIKYSQTMNQATAGGRDLWELREKERIDDQSLEVQKQHKQAVEETSAGMKVFSKVATGAVAAVSGLAGAALAVALGLKRMGKATLEQQEVVAQYNAKITGALVQLEVDRIGRNVQKGRATATSTARLAQSQSRLEEAWMPLENSMQTFWQTALALGQDMLSIFLEIVPAVKMIQAHARVLETEVGQELIQLLFKGPMLYVLEEIRELIKDSGDDERTAIHAFVEDLAAEPLSRDKAHDRLLRKKRRARR